MFQNVLKERRLERRCRQILKIFFGKTEKVKIFFVLRNANTNERSLVLSNFDRSVLTARSRVRFDFRTVAGKFFFLRRTVKGQLRAEHKLSPKPNSQFGNHVDPATALTTYRTILSSTPPNRHAEGPVPLW